MQTSKNPHAWRSRLSQRCHGHYALALRSIAAALFLICSSFIRHTYVTWQDDPCTTATITVHGVQTPPKLTLICGEKKVEVTGFQMPLPDKRRIYHFHLAQLEPDTEYVFSVADATGSFRTLAFEPPYRFIEGGDFENTVEAETLTKLAATYEPQAVFLGGDYPSTVLSSADYSKWDRWLDTYTKYLGMTPLVMAIGNHEVIGGYNQPKEQAPFFFHYFRTEKNPESYYTIPLGEKHQLYILDSGHHASHQIQAEWLKANLQERTNIALYHVPLFPSVRFPNKGLACHLAQKGAHIFKKKGCLFSPESYSGQQHWLPIFKEKIDIAFEHHDQTLKRTKAIGRTTYLGDGGWGCLRQTKPLQGLFHNYFVTLLGHKHFFWLIDIQDKNIITSAISVSNKQLDCIYFQNKLK